MNAICELNWQCHQIRRNARQCLGWAILISKDDCFQEGDNGFSTEVTKDILSPFPLGKQTSFINEMKLYQKRVIRKKRDDHLSCCQGKKHLQPEKKWCQNLVLQSVDKLVPTSKVVDQGWRVQNYYHLCYGRLVKKCFKKIS